jgi:hypothetical protein
MLQATAKFILEKAIRYHKEYLGSNMPLRPPQEGMWLYYYDRFDTGEPNLRLVLVTENDEAKWMTMYDEFKTGKVIPIMDVNNLLEECHKFPSLIINIDLMKRFCRISCEEKNMKGAHRHKMKAFKWDYTIPIESILYDALLLRLDLLTGE